MRVLICGGRDFADEGRVRINLDHLLFDHGLEVLIHGGAKGADTLGAQWAEQREVAVKSYPADWRTYGRAAGPIRNEQMLRDGKPDLVIAFPGGRGTANMVSLAKAAGVRVVQVA